MDFFPPHKAWFWLIMVVRQMEAKLSQHQSQCGSESVCCCGNRRLCLPQHSVVVPSVGSFLNVTATVTLWTVSHLLTRVTTHSQEYSVLIGIAHNVWYVQGGCSLRCCWIVLFCTEKHFYYFHYPLYISVGRFNIGNNTVDFNIIIQLNLITLKKIGFCPALEKECICFK